MWSFEKYNHITPTQEVQYYQYNLDGKYIQSFNSEKDASKALGYKNLPIIEVCRGERKQAGGFMWRYEKKEKIEPYKKNKRIAPNKKKIYQFKLDGTFVAEWDSITLASKAIGASNPSSLAKCLKGKYKSAYGYIWRDKK